MPNWEYVDIEHDIMLPDPKDKRKHPVKVKAGVRRCRFAQHKDPKVKSTIPEILKMLLKARKDTRKKQKTEKNPFLWGLLEAQQLAYKVTANSL